MRSENQEDWKLYIDYIYYLNNCLSKLSSFPGIAYRGIASSVSGYNVGEIIVWNAYSSCTTSPNVAKKFLKGGIGSLFCITSKKAKKINELSEFPKKFYFHQIQYLK